MKTALATTMDDEEERMAGKTNLSFCREMMVDINIITHLHVLIRSNIK